MDGDQRGTLSDGLPCPENIAQHIPNSSNVSSGINQRFKSFEPQWPSFHVSRPGLTGEYLAPAGRKSVFFFHIAEY
jgi:hypothetical protein